MLDEFFLLARRVSGLSMSVTDFWETDCDTFYHLLNNEREIIKEEMKQQKNQELQSKNPRMKVWDGDDQVYTDIYEELENQ